MMLRIKKLLLIPLLLLCMGACEGVDCTLNNIVLCHFSFYSSTTGSAIALGDTLTVTAQGTDSILFNRGKNTSTLSLPMSYWKDADTLNFIVDTQTGTYTSRVIIRKTNMQHYESPDCPIAMFHYITDASATGIVIDSVVVSRNEVNYLQDENIKIFVRTDAAAE